MAANMTKEDAVAKAKSVRASKFKLGKHNTMERFCTIFIAFILVLSLITISAVHQKIQNSKIILTAQAIYGNGETTFSLTQDVVKIDGLWTNKDKTKAFILIHLPGGMANLSTNADDYKMFMTGVKTKLKCSPLGSIYVFGSTGYIGLGFTDAAGFDAAAYQIVLRNTSYMSEADTEAAATKYEGGSASFVHNNQLQIIANFAASGAQVANFYSKPDYTATDIYSELVQSNLIDAKKTECDQIVDSINTSMRKANEYSRRLEIANITMEEPLPFEIYGDTVSTTASTDMPVRFDPNSMVSMNSGNLDSADGFFTCVDTNDEKVYPKGSSLYYSTGYVFPGGLNYDYHDLTADTNLLSQIVPAGETYTQFVDDLDNEQTTYTVDTSAKFGDYIDSRNGTTFSKDQDNTDLVGEDAKTNINNYEAEISNIFSKKHDLQITKLRELLKLYYDTSSVDAMTSVDMATDVLTMY